MNNHDPDAHVVDILADPPRLGLYAHFPWCVKKCPYCDFNSHPLKGNLREDAYIGALQKEFHARAANINQANVGRFDSVFFGGGTPSLFSADALRSFIETINPHLRPGAEVSMEANPGAGEWDDLRAYREAGINRLSIGAQSFSPTSLRRLGRIHGAGETHACVAAARRGGFDNINLDVMYGLPGQSPKAALDDLETAIALSPEHLSWYQLTIEPKTDFARHPPQDLPDEAALFEMEKAGRVRLEQAGYHRYEISAYAQPGAACLHNLVYWTFGDYLGLGAGAHGKHGGAIDSISQPGREPSLQISPERAPTAPMHPAKQIPPVVRTRNPRSPRLYLQGPHRTDLVPVCAAELPGEFMMNALRLVGGVPRRLFKARTGLSWRVVEPVWRKTTELGLTESDRIAATPLGLRHLDTLVQYFL